MLNPKVLKPSFPCPALTGSITVNNLGLLCQFQPELRRSEKSTKNLREVRTNKHCEFSKTARGWEKFSTFNIDFSKNEIYNFKGYKTLRLLQSNNFSIN